MEFKELIKTLQTFKNRINWTNLFFSIAVLGAVGFLIYQLTRWEKTVLTAMNKSWTLTF